MDQAVVIVCTESEARSGQVAAKNSNSRLKEFIKMGEIHVQLKGLPQAQFSLMRIARADQQVQRPTMPLQKIAGDVCANVSG